MTIKKGMWKKTSLMTLRNIIPVLHGEIHLQALIIQPQGMDG
jgi:hypothetical protein